MKDFLKKYLTTEQLEELKAKYLVDNPEAKELPVHISKGRLDEVLTKKKTAEDSLAALIKEKEEWEKAKSSFEAQKAEAIKLAQTAWETEKQKEVEGLKKTYEENETIIKAKGRNVKAIRALLDPTKPFADEFARVQKEEKYLFDGETDIPAGTGKKNAGQENGEDAEVLQMKKAVGIL